MKKLSSSEYAEGLDLSGFVRDGQVVTSEKIFRLALGGAYLSGMIEGSNRAWDVLERSRERKSDVGQSQNPQ